MARGRGQASAAVPGDDILDDRAGLGQDQVAVSCSIVSPTQAASACPPHDLLKRALNQANTTAPGSAAERLIERGEREVEAYR